jgi:hypothetical protein
MKIFLLLLFAVYSPSSPYYRKLSSCKKKDFTNPTPIFNSKILIVNITISGYCAVYLINIYLPTIYRFEWNVQSNPINW